MSLDRTSQVPKQAPAPALDASRSAGAGHYLVTLPQPEASRLVHPFGPLRNDEGFVEPGVVQHLGDGLVRLDAAARHTLMGRYGQDWCIEWRGNVQVLVIGSDEYEVRNE